MAPVLKEQQDHKVLQAQETKALGNTGNSRKTGYEPDTQGSTGTQGATGIGTQGTTGSQGTQGLQGFQGCNITVSTTAPSHPFSR